jgi:hypothetical protein
VPAEGESRAAAAVAIEHETLEVARSEFNSQHNRHTYVWEGPSLRARE